MAKSNIYPELAFFLQPQVHWSWSNIETCWIIALFSEPGLTNDTPCRIAVLRLPLHLLLNVF